MRKNGLMALALAAVLVMVPVYAFAAKSPSYSGGSSSGGGSSSSSSTSAGGGLGVASVTGPQVITTADGTKVSVTNNTTDVKGNAVALVIDTTTTVGEQISANSKGEAVAGSTAFSIPTGEAATAGLPENVVNTINAINAGNLGAVPGVNMTGYTAVSGTVPIVTKDAATDAVKVGDVEATLRVTSIPDNGIVEILFYNNATGTWSIIKTTKVDPTTKIVSFTMPGSGTAVLLTK